MARTATLPEPSWLVPDLVPDSGTLFIVAAPSAGKTFLSLVIAKTAAAKGRPVFLVLEEGGPRVTGDRFRDLAFDPITPVYIAHLRGVLLGDRDTMRLLISALRSHEAPILVLDPFSSVFFGDENDTQAVNAAKKQLEKLARANPRGLIALLHHTSRAGERGDAGGPEMFAARGSTVLPGWADFQLNLKHDPMPHGSGQVGFIATVAKFRDGERGYRARVRITLGSGTVDINEAMAEADESGTERMREAMRQNPGANTTVLAKAAHMRKKNALPLIDKIRAEEGGAP